MMGLAPQNPNTPGFVGAENSDWKDQLEISEETVEVI